MTPYLVSKFEKATLSALIRECFGYEFSDIFSKPQVSYIFNYLTTLGAQAVLLEPEYIDREFLEDYSNYYVKRFGNDGYVCSRLHFFSCPIRHQSLDELLLGEPGGDLTIEKLQEHYLGFMVIKPITKTFVGKTCLRRIGEKDCGAGIRKKISKRYDVNLFGVKLHVDSIAFQEQDKVVAACATTAVWTALHGFPGRDVRNIKSCSEITTAALNFAVGSNNGFPNGELSNEQIQRTLDVEGLRYHNTNLSPHTPEWFCDYLSSHIDSNLPVILTGTVYSLKRITQPTRKTEVTRLAGHAITVLGYDFRKNAKWVYMHDDRLGPYARAQVISLKKLLGEELASTINAHWALAVSKRNDRGVWAKPHEFLVPDVAIAPADKKARLPYVYAYETAQRIAVEVNRWMANICPLLEISQAAFDFKIRLASVAEVRASVLTHTAHCQEGNTLGAGEFVFSLEAEDIERWAQDKIKFLTTHLARLQWQIDFSWADQPIFTLLLDATDIPAGNAVSGVYFYDLLYSFVALGAFIEQQAKPGELDQQHFYNAFLKTLKDREDDYESHLQKTYGALRAPNYLKDDEVSETGEGTNRTTKRFFDPSVKRLSTLFAASAKDKFRNLIWAIGKDGSLFVAEDITKPKVLGHPSMTGLHPARIAGEMWCEGEGKSAVWYVNSESGRYSRDYATPEVYLKNAIRKIASIFSRDKFQLGGTRPREEQVDATLAGATNQVPELPDAKLATS